MPSEPSAFAVAVRALDVAFVHHANAGQLGDLVRVCYAEDALVLPPNLPLVQGRGQIRELFREMLDAGSNDVMVETKPLHVAGDLGYGFGTYTVAVRSPGGEPRRDAGKYVLVYRRQADGTWKVALAMFSSDLPAR